MTDRARQGERSERFERLFRAEYRLVARYVRRRADRDLVDDLVDEVFLVVWRRMDQMPVEPRAWLLTVARNVVGTHLRGVQRGRALEDRLAANLADPVASPDSLRQGDVVSALAGLREKDREALLLVAWEGLSTAEGAQVLGERPATFRMRLSRARRRLRASIEQSEQSAHGEIVTTEVTNA